MKKVTCKAITSINAFTSLEENTKEEICKRAHIIKLDKGNILFLEKDKINKFYALLKGKVSLYRLSANGQKRVFFILGEGSLINEVVFDELPVSVVCEAFEDCEIIEFDKEEFLRIMASDFQLTMQILNSIGKKQRRLYRQLKNTLPIGMEKRLAAKLWKLSKDHGVEDQGEKRIDMKISMTYLSYMLGTSRECISRAMKVLTKMDAVRWQGRTLYVKEDILLKYYRD